MNDNTTMDGVNESDWRDEESEPGGIEEGARMNYDRNRQGHFRNESKIDKEKKKNYMEDERLERKCPSFFH